MTRLGFEDRGEQGERLTFAEQVEAKQEKAEERADRMEDCADKAGAEANARHRAADKIADCIPFGQPILVGHHSEGRHRRDLAKIDSNMQKTFDATERRQHYEQRAETARATAEGQQYSNPAFLGRRIKEHEAEEWLLLNRLAGKFYAHSDQEPITTEYRTTLEGLLVRCQDKLGFYRHCLETCGKKTFDKDALQGKTAVFIRCRWETIVRLNKTTVSVLNTVFGTPEQQKKYALKYPYLAIQDAR